MPLLILHHHCITHINNLLHKQQVDVHTEPPEDTTTATDTTDDTATTAAVAADDEDEVDNSHVNYKNFCAPDPAYGGAPPLLVDRCLEDACHGLLFIGSGGGKTSGIDAAATGGKNSIVCLRADNTAIPTELVNKLGKWLLILYINIIGKRHYKC